MDIIITLIYILFCICLVYPPTEVVSAGFTLTQIFDGYLGSENTNFVKYHMKRVTITAFAHSALPLGYIFCLWCGGVNGPWMLSAVIGTTIIPAVMFYKIIDWWSYDKSLHPIVKPMLPYVTPGIDWRLIAANLNSEFNNIDKIVIPLTATSKFIATQNWIIMVTQYKMHLVKQNECTLVATATDSHSLTQSEEDEVQFISIEAIPSTDNVKKFSFRMSASALRDLQPRLFHPIRIPDHLSVLPTLVDRFVPVFRQYVDQNPVYVVDQELEPCIGCMQATADVKLNKRCVAPPEHLGLQGGPRPCQQCNCRVLWCCGCMGRWWAARAGGDPAQWLAGRCTCPVCRATFCLLDICPVATPEVH